MSRDLRIYRDYYKRYGGKNQTLNDIWDKTIEALEDHGMSAQAEYIGLEITEWIRTTWGGLMLTERHVGDPANISRYDQLQSHAMQLLDKTAPGSDNHAIATEIVRRVRLNYAGEYITSIPKFKQLQRDQNIWAKGNTPAQIEQLAKANGISLVRAYQINREMQENRDLREQLLLFG